MRQNLTHDSVERYVEASPQTLYDVIADVTRTPELSPEVVACEWLDGAPGPAVGVRFRATNHSGRGPDWHNTPVITVARRGREFAFSRTERGAGTIVWRYVFTQEGSGTRVTESYEVTRPVTLFGWFIIGVLYGNKDRRGDLHRGMTETLQRLAALTEKSATAAQIAHVRPVK
jgi:Polyketide cyclase / dehydrase and lipid transport